MFILKKFLSLIVFLRYGWLASDRRYYYRDTYLCKLIQLKYLFNDFVFKRKYKTIVSQGEFGQELQFVLPFAYWHYKNGTLKSTVGCKLTKELYFFSEDHTEKFDIRTETGNYNYEIPRILFSQDYDIEKWCRVPLKEMYSNDIYRFEKPILIIANRFNMEWDGPPISYYGIDMLSDILKKVSHKYTVIYNRPRPVQITMDNSYIYDLNEIPWLRSEYPDVLLMEDLYAENKGGAANYNHFQLMVYANSEHFISAHGGTATLASYFGGVNLIFSKRGMEHHFKCFQKLYPKFSGATILHARTAGEVNEYVNQYFA